MQGYIKLYRRAFESDIFDNEKLLKVWVWCLFKATHKPRTQRVGRQTVELEPGQFVTGRKAASHELRMTETTVWRYIKDLEQRGSLAIKTNNKYSVLSIEKWGFYQQDEENVDSTLDNKWTTNGQQMDTNKNVKNVKNKNNKQLSEDSDAGLVERVVAHLNEKTGKHYRHTTPQTVKLIKARLRDGFIEPDFIRVIDIKTAEWLGDDGMNQYLRPQTLFGTKFESYLNSEPKKAKGRGPKPEVFGDQSPWRRKTDYEELIMN